MHGGTGGEQNDNERRGLHSMPYRQRFIAQVLALCDKANTFHLLLRFCLAAFAKGAPFA
jgi:hypothetical protein